MELVKESTTDIRDLIDEGDKLGEIEQTQYQHESPSITLYEIEGDRIISEENDGSNTEYYELDAEERKRAKSDTDGFLANTARGWADNTDESRLECYRWGIDSPEEDKVADDYAGSVMVVKEGNYYDYTPYDFICDDDDELIIFDNVETAKAWINEHEAGDYYCENGEAERPTYYIVA